MFLLNCLLILCHFIQRKLVITGCLARRQGSRRQGRRVAGGRVAGPATSRRQGSRR